MYRHFRYFPQYCAVEGSEAFLVERGIEHFKLSTPFVRHVDEVVLIR